MRLIFIMLIAFILAADCNAHWPDDQNRYTYYQFIEDIQKYRDIKIPQLEDKLEQCESAIARDLENRKKYLKMRDGLWPYINYQSKAKVSDEQIDTLDYLVGDSWPYFRYFNAEHIDEHPIIHKKLERLVKAYEGLADATFEYTSDADKTKYYTETIKVYRKHLQKIK